MTTTNTSTEVAAAPKHLYYVHWTCADGCWPPHPGRECFVLRQCEITRITACRIYFQESADAPLHRREREWFISRIAIELGGVVWHRALQTTLYLEPPELRACRKPKTVTQLRREMAALHPDRGGDPAEFRAAHARYVAAKAVDA
jgi:hypothetical protein